MNNYYSNNNWIKGKIVNSLKGTVRINRNNIIINIKREELSNYLKDGWVKGTKNYSYKYCSNFAAKNNVKNSIEWKKISKNNNMPYNPNRVFENEWINWDSFLQKHRK